MGWLESLRWDLRSRWGRLICVHQWEASWARVVTARAPVGMTSSKETMYRCGQCGKSRKMLDPL